MISHPVAIIAILLAIESAVLVVASHEKTKKYFSFIPSIFWIYFLPILASSFGLIDAKNPIYSQMSNWLLPMSLFLLLVTVDIRAILRLGAPALMIFFIGSIGVSLGASVSFWLFKPIVGAEFWSGFGTITGSWTGGSANMIAVKEALGTPDAVFLPMVIVDTLIPYLWMGILVILSQHQKKFDEFNHSNQTILDQIYSQVKHPQHIVQVRKNPVFIIYLVMLGFLGALCAKTFSQFLPIIPHVITEFAWVIIVVSSLAIFLSFTPMKKIEKYGSTKVGYFLLYFVLTTIGAKAAIGNMGSVLYLFVAALVIVFIHACVLLVAARLLRTPLFLVAVASQANLGGVASAPMVAEIYQKGLGAVGLLLAILGNIFGTYIGIFTGQICLFLSR